MKPRARRQRVLDAVRQVHTEGQPVTTGTLRDTFGGGLMRLLYVEFSGIAQARAAAGVPPLRPYMLPVSGETPAWTIEARTEAEVELVYLLKEITKGPSKGIHAPGRSYFDAREAFECYLVRLGVQACDGDREAAARWLGVSLSTIKEKRRSAQRPSDSGSS